MDIIITIILILIILIIKFAILNNIVIKMTGAIPLSVKEAREVYAILRRLSKETSIPTPKVYLIPSPQTNALLKIQKSHNIFPNESYSSIISPVYHKY